MIHHLPNGTIHHARVEAVYPTIEPGSVTLVHSDGPYGMNKAEWDRVKDLAAWYRPHIAEWGRLCAPSASVYLWNTAEGWAAIHPEMVAAGWTFGALITWDKIWPKELIGAATMNGWPTATEVCGYYQRCPLPAEVRAIRGDRNYSEAARAVGCDSRLVALWEGWPHVHGSCLPTLGQWCALGGRADVYPRLRPAFDLPIGVTNVWAHPLVGGAERLKGGDGGTLHPCQKPLLFARRIVEASSRPGDLVFEPFGGTCRIAAACEDIARWEPEKARRYVCVEMDEDGRDYIPAVLASLRGEAPASAGRAGQLGMFGGLAR